jgi:hypothetical protein
MKRSGLRAVCLAVPLLGFISPADAQLVPIKTIPFAQGTQFEIFPSNNIGMGAVSIALTDSIGDPYVNPATTSRVRASFLFTSPTVYSLSDDAGGGQSLPFSMLVRRNEWFGGLGFALQEVDPARAPQDVGGPVAFDQPTPPPPGGGGGFPGPVSTIPGPNFRPHGNKYAFGMIGRAFRASNLSVGASAHWTGLHALDGVEVLYNGSRAITQTGDVLDLRLGALKEWPGERGVRSLEGILFHNRFAATHEVLFADVFWDPNQQVFREQARVDTNYDHTNTWGAQLEYQMPLAPDGWRIGWLATVNQATHPKNPKYEMAGAAVIPRDPGHSSAFNLGIGVSKVLGPSQFGLDLIYQPIRSYTWADAPVPLATLSGDTIAAGGKTLDNRFDFSNALLRLGFGHDVPLEGSKNVVGFQFGLMLRSIHYDLHQTDYLQELQRSVQTGWLEWTPTWGISLRAPELEVRYQGRVTEGGGRPGGGGNFGFVAGRDMALSSGTLLTSPNGALSHVGVHTTTHQLTLSVPLH